MEHLDDIYESVLDSCGLTTESLHELYKRYQSVTGSRCSERHACHMKLCPYCLVQGLTNHVHSMFQVSPSNWYIKRLVAIPATLRYPCNVTTKFFKTPSLQFHSWVMLPELYHVGDSCSMYYGYVGAWHSDTLLTQQELYNITTPTLKTWQRRSKHTNDISVTVTKDTYEAVQLYLDGFDVPSLLDPTYLGDRELLHGVSQLNKISNSMSLFRLKK